VSREEKAMTTITLQPDIEKEINHEARHRKASVEDIANEWLRHQAWEQRRRKISEETKRYVALHAELRQQYADKVIAMQDGKVIDVGDELDEVYRRVHQKFGEQAILITRVGVEPIQTYKIRNPRLATQLP